MERIGEGGGEEDSNPEKHEAPGEEPRGEHLTSPRNVPLRIQQEGEVEDSRGSRRFGPPVRCPLAATPLAPGRSNPAKVGPTHSAAPPRARDDDGNVSSRTTRGSTPDPKSRTSAPPPLVGRARPPARGPRLREARLHHRPHRRPWPGSRVSLAVQRFRAWPGLFWISSREVEIPSPLPLPCTASIRESFCEFLIKFDFGCNSLQRRECPVSWSKTVLKKDGMDFYKIPFCTLFQAPPRPQRWSLP